MSTIKNVTRPSLDLDADIRGVISRGGLTNKEIRTLAPAAFATTFDENVSSRYERVSTREVIDIAREAGFIVIRAEQPSGSMKNPHAQHRIEFMPKDSIAALLKITRGRVTSEGSPTIIVTNSHNRSKAFTFLGGYWRLVCSNGMVAPVGIAMGARVTHIGQRAATIMNHVVEAVKLMGSVNESVARLQARTLNKPERLAFAEYAVELRWHGYYKIPVEPLQLLEPRRDFDRSLDAWTVLNTVQENVVRGGLKSVTGRHTNGVTSFALQQHVNRRLWEGADVLTMGGIKRLDVLREQLRVTDKARV